MPRRCPECKLAAPRQRPSALRPREDGFWRQMAARPPRATRRAASAASGPRRAEGSGGRHVRTHRLGYAHLPNSGVSRLVTYAAHSIPIRDSVLLAAPEPAPPHHCRGRSKGRIADLERLRVGLAKMPPMAEGPDLCPAGRCLPSWRTGVGPLRCRAHGLLQLRRHGPVVRISIVSRR